MMPEEEKKLTFLQSLKKTILNTEKAATPEENTSEAQNSTSEQEENKTLHVKSVSPSVDANDNFKFKGVSTATDTAIKFAENFVDSGGKFIFAENIPEVFQFLSSLKADNKWNHIFPTTFSLKTLMKEFQFQTDDFETLLENANAAVSFCYSLSAAEGVIVLTPEEATTRRLVSFPENHIIIAFKDQLKENIDEAIAGFQEKFDDRLASVLELYPEKPVARTYHKTLLSAEGPKNVYLFYIDSEIE